MGEADTHRANFSFMGRSVALYAHDASVIPTLSALLDLTAEAHGPADCSVAVREDAGRIAVVTTYETKHYDALSGAIVAAAQVVPYFLLPYAPGYVLHGGAFVADGKAHLFLGPGHVGKSTTALEAWLMGYEVLGDDYLWLDLSTATVRAVPKPLKLRRSHNTLPDRLKEVLPPASYCLGYAEDLWVLILSRGLPRMASLHQSFPIGGIHLLERTDETTSTCHPADRHRFVRSVFEQLVKAPRNDLDILRCLSAIFRDGRATALRVGNNANAAAVTAMVASVSGTDSLK
jgi:hypothetical protein